MTIREEFEEHFNEPVLTHKLGRLIGYGEDDCDCYLIIQYMGGEVIWHTAVGGYYWLDRLKGQEAVTSTEGEEWDDFYRLDNLLGLNGAPRADKFLVLLHDERIRYQIDLIRNNGDDASTALEAAKRIIDGADFNDSFGDTVSRELIDLLAQIAFDPESKLWSRIAAIYSLGFVDQGALTEARIREIACDPKQYHELRDHADEALYYFASRCHARQHKLDHPDADTYQGLRYQEWRSQQTDLAPEDPQSFAARLALAGYGYRTI